MPLLPCVECGHAISRHAATCPQCGHPQMAVAAHAPLGDASVPPAGEAAADAGATRTCFRCGQQEPAASRYCSRCGLMATSAPLGARPAPLEPPVFSAEPAVGTSPTATLERIAEYERVSAILWLILGIIQVITVVAIVAGIWNIFAALTRFKLPAMIRARAASIPSIYEGITQLIIIGLVNLFLGGVVGVLFVAFDFYVRSLVLQHRELFEPTPNSVPAPAPPPVLPPLYT